MRSMCSSWSRSRLTWRESAWRWASCRRAKARMHQGMGHCHGRTRSGSWIGMCWCKLLRRSNARGHSRHWCGRDGDDARPAPYGSDLARTNFLLACCVGDSRCRGVRHCTAVGEDAVAGVGMDAGVDVDEAWACRSFCVVKHAASCSSSSLIGSGWDSDGRRSGQSRPPASGRPGSGRPATPSAGMGRPLSRSLGGDTGNEHDVLAAGVKSGSQSRAAEGGSMSCWSDPAARG